MLDGCQQVLLFGGNDIAQQLFAVRVFFLSNALADRAQGDRPGEDLVDVLDFSGKNV